MPRGSCKNRRLGGTYRLHHQGDKNRWTRDVSHTKYFFAVFISRQLTASVVPSSLILVTLMKEELSSSETSVLIRATWRDIPEDAILNIVDDWTFSVAERHKLLIVNGPEMIFNCRYFKKSAAFILLFYFLRGSCGFHFRNLIWFQFHGSNCWTVGSKRVKLGTDVDHRNCGLIPNIWKNCSVLHSVQIALKPVQTPIQCISVAFCNWVKQLDMKVTEEWCLLGCYAVWLL
jgi:hypothetical protein